MERRRQRWLWGGTALLLLLCAAYSLVQWGTASTPDHTGGAQGSLTVSEPEGGRVPPAEIQLPAARVPPRPVAISIPAIGVSSDLVSLGLNDDGTVEVPRNPDLAGWYRWGTRPGADGSAVILGHVDSMRGPAVFNHLGALRRGDLVEVRTADGTAEWFRVQSVRLYPNDQFPAERIYAAQDGRSLNLVTCGGEYDAARGGYQANVVVHARWQTTQQS